MDDLQEHKAQTTWKFCCYVQIHCVNISYKKSAERERENVTHDSEALQRRSSDAAGPQIGDATVVDSGEPRMVVDCEKSRGAVISVSERVGMELGRD